MKRIILKRGEEKRIIAGHPWVYDNEIERVLDRMGESAELEAGETADIESAGKQYLGRAFVNPHSKITARIYSPSKEGVDKGFFKRRIKEALEKRSCYDLSKESARLVFAEADFLPGLIIDRFVGWSLEDAEPLVSARPLTFAAMAEALGKPSSWLSVQFLVFGMDSRKDMILAVLEEILAHYPSHTDEPLGVPNGVIERDGAKVRELEGLPLKEAVIEGSFPRNGVVVFENGFPFIVNLESGQKTGHFLDQRENRLRAASFIKEGDRVLDACSYTGGFGIAAARAGAADVLSVDASSEALAALQKNAFLNNVSEKITGEKADIFDSLRSMERRKERFDMVILDPPAFAKTHTALDEAIRGYKEINLRALKILKQGGTLVTCSCSYALNESRFKQVIASAALDAERRLYQLDFKAQPPDHPILVGYPESHYLKAGFFRAF